MISKTISIALVMRLVSRSSAQSFPEGADKRADLYFQCDNAATKVEYTHYNGESEVWSFESVGWPEEVHVILSDICSGDMINVYCENAGGNDHGGNPGGFIATLSYNGQKYSTKAYGYKQGHGPWIMWRSRQSGGAWQETWAADYKATKGGGAWGGNVGSNIASDAQWIFRNGYQAIQTQFRWSQTSNQPAACSSSAHYVDGNVLDDEFGGGDNTYVLAFGGTEMYAIVGFLAVVLMVLLCVNIVCCLKQPKKLKTVSYAKVDTVSDTEANNFL